MRFDVLVSQVLDLMGHVFQFGIRLVFQLIEFVALGTLYPIERVLDRAPSVVMKCLQTISTRLREMGFPPEHRLPCTNQDNRLRMF